jgi:hypothetical protein
MIGKVIELNDNFFGKVSGYIIDETGTHFYIVNDEGFTLPISKAQFEVKEWFYGLTV